MGSRETLENLTTAWRDAGLDASAVGPIEEVLTRYDAIERERSALPDEQGGLASLAERIAAGELGLLDGIVKLHDAEVASERGQGGVLKAPSRADRLFDAAQGAIIRLAVERLNGQASELVVLLEAEADGVQVEIEKLARVLEDIPAAALELVAGMTGAEQDAVYDWDLLEQAVAAAGKKQATAFDKLKELDRHRGELLRVAATLEAAGISRPSGLVNRSTFELAGLLPLPVGVAA